MTLNEKQITELSEKYGMHKWQIEDMIKVSDFTENRDFTNDGSAYNYNLLRELADSWKSFTTEKNPEKSRRAHQLFRELFEDIKAKLNELDTLKKKKSDFTDDGRVSWQISPEDEKWVHRMADKMRDLGDALDKYGVSFWHRMRYENTMKDVLRKLNDIYDRGKK